jgi:hypothetical protein
MFEFLKTKNFRKIFSFMIGIFIILVLRPICKGEDCLEHKNVTKEVANSTYQIGSKCYTFTPEAYLPK